jgi:endonuclease/exonuclease/phosphatase (EEP) superfamily protein YafD
MRSEYCSRGKLMHVIINFHHMTYVIYGNEQLLTVLGPVLSIKVKKIFFLHFFSHYFFFLHFFLVIVIEIAILVVMVAVVAVVAAVVVAAAAAEVVAAAVAIGAAAYEQRLHCRF